MFIGWRLAEDIVNPSAPMNKDFFQSQTLELYKSCEFHFVSCVKLSLFVKDDSFLQHVNAVMMPSCQGFVPR